MVMRRVATCLLSAALLAAPAAHAQLENENLLVTVPDGYKIDYRAKNDRELLNEMVPDAETVNNWTEMVTVQIFYGVKPSIDKYRTLTQDGWTQACPGSQFHDVTSGEENGYPFMVWLQSCPNNPQTGKPEHTWFKVIRGNDSFYIVEKAFKFMPDKDQITTWMQYLRRVSVCDSRSAEHACPAVKN